MDPADAPAVAAPMPGGVTFLAGAQADPRARPEGPRRRHGCRRDHAPARRQQYHLHHRRTADRQPDRHGGAGGLLRAKPRRSVLPPFATTGVSMPWPWRAAGGRSALWPGPAARRGGSTVSQIGRGAAGSARRTRNPSALLPRRASSGRRMRSRSARVIGRHGGEQRLRVGVMRRRQHRSARRRSRRCGRDT